MKTPIDINESVKDETNGLKHISFFLNKLPVTHRSASDSDRYQDDINKISRVDSED